MDVKTRGNYKIVLRLLVVRGAALIVHDGDFYRTPILGSSYTGVPTRYAK